MRRWLFPLGVALAGIGAALVGYGLFAREDAAEPAPVAAACARCPDNVTSAEMQDRDGSTLFVFHGDWPDDLADLPATLFLRVNDLDLEFAPTDDGFELYGADDLPEHSIAAGLLDGAFVVNVKDGVLEEPIEFSLSELVAAGTPQPQPQPEPQPEPEAETVKEFAALLAKAFREGDSAFLLERLNPASIELYGEEQCAALLETLTDPTRKFKVRKVKAEPYTYAPDGQSVEIPDAFTVTVQVTAGGQTATQDVHFAPVDGELTWFADCGDPLR